MHTDNPDFRTTESKKITFIGAIVNFVLSVSKVIAGFIANSQSLISDGVHSFADLATDALVWFAIKHSSEAPDEDHPYGHGRFETAATMALGILLILVAAGITWDAARRLFNPELLLVPGTLAIYVAIFSILVKEGLYWYTLKIANNINSPLLRANAWHHRSDAISSIIVLVGVIGTQAGLAYLDAIAAILVGFMIAKIGWNQARDAVTELVDTSLDAKKVARLSQAIQAVDGVNAMHLLRSRMHGRYASVDVHVQVDPWLSVSEGHMIAVAVELEAKRSLEEVEDITVHIDPEDDEEAPLYEQLPMRSEAIALLEKHWQDAKCYRLWERIQLHYVKGKIHVDVYIPAKCLEKQSMEQIHQELEAPFQNSDLFSRIRVYYSGNNNELNKKDDQTD